MSRKAYVDSLRQLMESFDGIQLEEAVLCWQSCAKEKLKRCTGSSLEPITQTDWELVYSDMQRGARAGLQLPDWEQRQAVVRELAEQQVVPIAVGNFPHRRLTDSFDRRLRAAAEKGEPIPLPKRPAAIFKKANAFFASALLPHTYNADFSEVVQQYQGFVVTFTLDPRLFFGPPSTLVEFDADDGKGFRPVLLGQPVQVTYPEHGTKRMTVRCHYPHPTPPMQSTFKFVVGAPTDVPAANEVWPITADIAFKGVKYTGTAWVYYGKGHTQITDPLLLAEPFPGGRTRQKLYEDYNQLGIIDAMRERGYDVVLLGFPGPAEHVQGNGRVTIKCIQEIITRRQGDHKLLVGGASMGGLITRYALTYMEANNLPHQTRTYLSIDAPHRGAALPMGAQWLLRYLAYGNLGSAPEQVKMLNSNAARGMLYYYCQDAWETRPARDPLFTELQNELWQMGGYPRQVRRVAVANGAGDRKPIAPGRDMAFEWSLGVQWAQFKTDPHGADPGSDKAQTAWAYIIKATKLDWASYLNGYEQPGNAPGGLTNIAEQFDVGFRDYWGSRAVHHAKNCFVPTTSAMDSSYDFFAAPTQSYWHDVLWCASNLNHCQVNEQIKQFLLRNLDATAPMPETAEPEVAELPPAPVWTVVPGDEEARIPAIAEVAAARQV